MRARPLPNLFIKLLFLSVLTVGLNSCKGERTESLSEEPISFTKEGELTITRSGLDTSLVTIDIEIADSSYEIQTGMMYRNEISEKQGMLFVFPDEAPHSFYMKNTLVALDILFVDKDLKITKIHRNAVPLDETGIPSDGPVQYVLEVRAGMSERWGIQEGDKIQFQKTK